MHVLILDWLLHNLSYPWFPPLKNKECTWKMRTFPTSDVSHSTSCKIGKKRHKLTSEQATERNLLNLITLPKGQLTFFKQAAEYLHWTIPVSQGWVGGLVDWLVGWTVSYRIRLIIIPVLTIGPNMTCFCTFAWDRLFFKIPHIDNTT